MPVVWEDFGKQGFDGPNGDTPHFSPASPHPNGPCCWVPLFSSNPGPSMKKILYILGEFEDDDAAWLSQAGTQRMLSQGEVLIHEGQPIDSVFFVTQGRLSILRGPEMIEVDRVSAGEVLGEISYVDRRPPTATVSALEEAKVLVVSRTDLTEKLESDPGFAARFYKAIALFLADRFRKAVRQGRGGGGPSDEDDELDLQALETVSKAGVRFERILQHLQRV